MTLFVDIGNSAFKWMSSVESDVRSVRSFDYQIKSFSSLLRSQLEQERKPDSIVVSAVAATEVSDTFTAFCQTHWGLKPEYLSVSSSAAGIKNCYEDPTQLGIDRWLGVIAAWSRFRQPVCVIDCGTALTIDIVNASAEYVGGFISPGPELMREALKTGTSRLLLSDEISFNLKAGKNTQDCIDAGVLSSLTGLIHTVLDNVQESTQTEYQCIITGGYAGQLVRLINREVEFEPYLLFQGMKLLSEEQS